MKKPTIYLVAVLACAGIVLIYAIIGVLLGWKHGGGVLPMIILFGALTATWKGITGLSKRKVKNDDIQTTENDNNPTK